jgi:basic membrane lipoprotein Med (substrate-binding protein (PBP1-ABC) superfamily)
MKRSGEWKGGVYNWGMKEGWAKLIWNEALKSKVPEEIISLTGKIQDDIINGKLKVPIYEDWNPERWK